jgi:prevent-host-death family protein
MRSLEVHELKEHLSEILDRVQEKEETVEITNDGKVVAFLIPVLKPHPSFERPEGDIWTDMDRLAAEIAARWQGCTSAVDAVRDVRRDL